MQFSKCFGTLIKDLPEFFLAHVLGIARFVLVYSELFQDPTDSSWE